MTKKFPFRYYAIVAAYEAGEDPEALASFYGLDATYVKSLLSNARSEGVLNRQFTKKGHPKKGPSERTLRMIDRYLTSTDTMAEIGQEFGVSSQSVQMTMKRWGVWQPSRERNELRRTERFEASAELVQAEFRKTYSLKKTIEALEGKVPAGDVRKHLVHKPKVFSRSRETVRKFSDEELLGYLREAATDGSVSIKGYTKWKDGLKGRTVPTPLVYNLRFGSWANACSLAGVKTGPMPPFKYKRRWTDEQAFQGVSDYVNVCEANGERCTFQGYSEWARGNDVPSGPWLRMQLKRPWSQILAETYHRRDLHTSSE